MERRLAVHARAQRQALILALALVSGTAAAAPTSGEAKASFDRGVAAYTRGDYEGASEALGKSFELWPDPETLFAWAQTERKLGHCDKSIILYEKLLTFDLPAANKDAVRVQMNECKQLIPGAHTAPAHTEPARTEPPRTEKPGEKRPVDKPAEGDAEGDAAAALTADNPENPLAEPSVEPSGGRAWWHDPVGEVLIGTGVIGLGVGIVSLISAHSAESDKAQATTYFQYKSLDDSATSRGQIGVISCAAGGALVIGGVVWYMTHRHATESAAVPSATVSGWVAPGTGGFAVAGRF